MSEACRRRSRNSPVRTTSAAQGAAASPSALSEVTRTAPLWTPLSGLDGVLRLDGREVPGQVRRPLPAFVEPEERIRFGGEPFLDLAKRLLPLCGSDEPNSAVNRFSIRIASGRKPRFVVTDNFRLAEERLADIETATPPGDYFVQRSLIAAVVKVNAGGGDCLLGWSPRRQSLRTGRVRLQLSVGDQRSYPLVLDQLLAGHKASGDPDAVLTHPREAAEGVIQIPSPGKDAYGDPRPIRIRWKRGRMEAGYEKVSAVGDAVVRAEASSWFKTGFIAEALRAAPAQTRKARFYFPPDSGEGDFRKPMLMEFGRSLRILIMPVSAPVV